MQNNEQKESITVCYAEQRFSPVDYNSFGVGPFYMTTTIQPGETHEMAFSRAMKFLQVQARAAFTEAKKDFNERYTPKPKNGGWGKQ
jgi:hypothetical protein